MSIEKIEESIVVYGATLLGLLIYQFCLLHFNQPFPSFEMKWILGTTVLIELAIGTMGMWSLFTWICYEITHLKTTHHWR